MCAPPGPGEARGAEGTARAQTSGCRRGRRAQTCERKLGFVGVERLEIVRGLPFGLLRVPEQHRGGRHDVPRVDDGWEREIRAVAGETLVFVRQHLPPIRVRVHLHFLGDVLNGVHQPFGPEVRGWARALMRVDSPARGFHKDMGDEGEGKGKGVAVHKYGKPRKKKPGRTRRTIRTRTKPWTKPMGGSHRLKTLKEKSVVFVDQLNTQGPPGEEGREKGHGLVLFGGGGRGR